MTLASVSTQRERDKFVENSRGKTAVRVQAEIEETLPTDSTRLNGSFVFTYDGSGNLDTIKKVISGVTYTRDLTYSGSSLTNISAWY